MITRTAIIILTHNFLEEATRPCLESLFACKTAVAFQVVVVDNNSTDGTRQYLQQFARGRENVTIILSDRNTGYAGGNNIGIRSVEADCYILLNNDTIVTDLWLERLTGFFDRHPEVGMAGPVSNSVGNEQMVWVSSNEPSVALQEGKALAGRCPDHFFHTDMLGFFCVAIRKEVIGKVGLLDENFGIGMFEDDDYCLRVAEAGYKLACVEDVFIYHRGSVTFSSLGFQNYDLFDRNRALFEKKHGVPWKPRYLPDTYCTWVETQLEKLDDEQVLKAKISNKLRIVSSFGDLFLRARLAELELLDIKRSHSWQILVRLNRLFPIRRLITAWRKIFC